LEKATARWQLDPAAMVRELFGEEPDPWQEDVYRAFPVTPRIAMQACRGPGKTHTLAAIGWNYLLTRPHPRIAATSITGDNLRDGLWSEMALLQSKSELLKAMFELQKTRIVCRQHPETWWMSARTFSRSADEAALGSTLSGVHADYTLFLLDETGGMPRQVMSEAEAALSTGKECHIVQAGNPTEFGGALYHSVKRQRHLWLVFEISGDPDDPKRASRVGLQWARDQIAANGRDDPWVLANVFGKFAPGGIHQLISVEEVEAATRRHYREYDYARSPKLLGVDVAREGDDMSVIFPRQGLVAFQPMKYRNVSSVEGAGAVSRKWDEWDADACFVDATGGYGWGWIDQLRQRGYAPIPVQYAGNAHDKQRYANKRAEMAFDLVSWIKQGGAIPDIPELSRALTETTYAFKGDAYIIEPKEDIKAKLGFSPDDMDALMETFAEPVQPKGRAARGGSRHKFEWEPQMSYEPPPYETYR
jgi:hypothetical protein